MTNDIKKIKKITNRTSQGQAGKWKVDVGDKTYLIKENVITEEIVSIGWGESKVDIETTSNISEVVAYRIGRYFGLNTQPYHLMKSTELNIETKSSNLVVCEFIHYTVNLAQAVDNFKGREVFDTEVILKTAIKLGVTRKSLLQVLLFDALIGNSDRHLNNFLLEKCPNNTLKMNHIIDNGNSLLYNKETFVEYDDKSKPIKETHTEQIKYLDKYIQEELPIFNIYSDLKQFMSYIETDKEIVKAFKIMNNPEKVNEIKKMLKHNYFKFIDKYIQKPYILLDKYKKDSINYCSLLDKTNNNIYEVTEQKLIEDIKTGRGVDNLKLVNRKGKIYVSKIKNY